MSRMRIALALFLTGAVLGLAGIGSEASDLRVRLEKAVDFIEDLHLAEVMDQEVEVVATPLATQAVWAGPEEEEDPL